MKIVEVDYIEDTPKQKYDYNYERIFGNEKDKERPAINEDEKVETKKTKE